MTPRCRIAPSPTGPLHIGTARTALFNFLFARQHGGTFILRLEDTDQARSTLAYERDILDGLHWLGLEWDEGPEVAGQPARGPYGPYRQSERTALYAAAIDHLLAEDRAYPCFCTTDELAADREAQQKAKQDAAYVGRCASLTQDERAARRAEGRPAVIRFRVGSERVEFDDLVRGHVGIDTSALGGDLVIARSDGSPLYHFVVVVDDIEMRISHVIRGEDHLSNTPKHVLLFRALGAEPPVFAHLPLILNPDRSKMSKRKSQTAIDAYRRQGYVREAIVNHLALLGWSSGSDEEVFSMEDLVAGFDLGRVQPSGAIFDLARLDWLNGQWIRRLPPDELTERALPFLADSLATEAAPGRPARIADRGRPRAAAAHGDRAPATPRRHRPDARLRLRRGPRRGSGTAGSQALGRRHHGRGPGGCAGDHRGHRRGQLRGRRAGAAAAGPLRGAGLESRRPLHGHPRGRHRPHGHATALRHHGGHRLRAQPGPPQGGRGTPSGPRPGRPGGERVMTRTVLVVDDEPTLRETLAEAMRADGLRVMTAADGREALERFRSDPPDLVLLDLMLPQLSGIEVCRILRRESAVPIIMLTAKDSEIDKVVGLELGADDYVTKPFSLRELLARIRAQLRRLDTATTGSGAEPDAPRLGHEPLRLGAVTIDLAGHRLMRDGKALPIKPKAFELLSFLVRNPGQVFSRDQLLERVWGYDYAGETRTVDVHVHWLRSAIEADPSQPRYLQTIRGTGYVLRLPVRDDG